MSCGQKHAHAPRGRPPENAQGRLAPTSRAPEDHPEGPPRLKHSAPFACNRRDDRQTSKKVERCWREEAPDALSVIGPVRAGPARPSAAFWRLPCLLGSARPAAPTFGSPPPPPCVACACALSFLKTCRTESRKPAVMSAPHVVSIPVPLRPSLLSPGDLRFRVRLVAHGTLLMVYRLPWFFCRCRVKFIRSPDPS